MKLVLVLLLSVSSSLAGRTPSSGDMATALRSMCDQVSRYIDRGTNVSSEGKTKEDERIFGLFETTTSPPWHQVITDGVKDLLANFLVNNVFFVVQLLDILPDDLRNNLVFFLFNVATIG